MTHFRSQNLLDAAENQPCVICGAIGTTVAAHANSVALGKGTGIKVPDYFTAWVCQVHHEMIDGVRRVELPYRSPFDLWTWAYIKTVEQWFKQEVVRVS